MRFTVAQESKTGHCCFIASVLDAEAEYPDLPICECFDLPSAHKIAEALNAHDNAPLQEENDV
jgi:hypothetical protein